MKNVNNISHTHADHFFSPYSSGGPASQSGLRPGDRILKLDGYEVRDLTHNELIALLRKSGDEPKMVVETGPPLPSEGKSHFLQRENLFNQPKLT